ncbi:hypothetical protein [Cupriavidus nantongensis]|uniref:Uncharacterized protein n=1 Tax=Cupriavidus nantongensis TaxID=1796606 RepID=A0A142JKG0_9BURK|nr:hypothetical protein [Cupriavidus nantongensis]AMR78572.1 hypothetical protein A2G96_12930 [Cupriavidus nantongensis]
MQGEGTLKAMTTGHAGKSGGYEITASGKALLVALLFAIGIAGYLYTESNGWGSTEASAAVPREAAAPPPSIVGLQSKEAPASPVHSTGKEPTAVLLAALRATTEAQSARLSEAERALNRLETQLESLPKATSPRAKEEAAVSAQTARKTVAEAKVSKVDVSALPVEFMTAEKSGISSFDSGSVVIAGTRHTVGAHLPSGELLVAVDPQTRTVVTDKRIVNVPN